MILKFKTKRVDEMTYYSVYDEQIQSLRTDYAYYEDKVKLKAMFENHMLDFKDVSPNQTEIIWSELGYKIIETPMDFINESEQSILTEVVHGKYNHVNKGWFDDFNAIDKADLKSIIEFKEFGFAGAWYVVFTNTNKPLVIKHKINNVNTSHTMNYYKSCYKLKTHEMSYKTVY